MSVYVSRVENMKRQNILTSPTLLIEKKNVAMMTNISPRIGLEPPAIENERSISKLNNFLPPFPFLVLSRTQRKIR